MAHRVIKKNYLEKIIFLMAHRVIKNLKPFSNNWKRFEIMGRCQMASPDGKRGRIEAQWERRAVAKLARKPKEKNIAKKRQQLAEAQQNFLPILSTSFAALQADILAKYIESIAKQSGGIFKSRGLWSIRRRWKRSISVWQLFHRCYSRAAA